MEDRIQKEEQKQFILFAVCRVLFTRRLLPAFVRAA